MKKLTLILILLVWLAGCNNNWKLIGNNWKWGTNWKKMEYITWDDYLFKLEKWNYDIKNIFCNDKKFYNFIIKNYYNTGVITDYRLNIFKTKLIDFLKKRWINLKSKNIKLSIYKNTHFVLPKKYLLGKIDWPWIMIWFQQVPFNKKITINPGEKIDMKKMCLWWINNWKEQNKNTIKFDLTDLVDNSKLEIINLLDKISSINKNELKNCTKVIVSSYKYCISNKKEPIFMINDKKWVNLWKILWVKIDSLKDINYQYYIDKNVKQYQFYTSIRWLKYVFTIKIWFYFKNNKIFIDSIYLTKNKIHDDLSSKQLLKAYKIYKPDFIGTDPTWLNSGYWKTNKYVYYLLNLLSWADANTFKIKLYNNYEEDYLFGYDNNYVYYKWKKISDITSKEFEKTFAIKDNLSESKLRENSFRLSILWLFHSKKYWYAFYQWWMHLKPYFSPPKTSYKININNSNWELIWYLSWWKVDSIDIASLHNLESYWEVSDDSWYTLNKFKKWDKKFIYRISPKFNNIPCIWNNIQYTDYDAFIINYYYSWTIVWQDKISCNQLYTMLWGNFNEQLNRLYENNISDKLKSIAKILETEGCNLTSKIPTESWKSVDLICNWFSASLLYSWDSEYILSIEWDREPMYYVYIKNWKITKEWYNICWKWFKTMDEFYNLSWELAVWDIWSNKCKFIDITSWFKYSGYYVNWKLITQINNIFNGIDWKPTWIFYINDNKNKSFDCYKTKDDSWCEYNLDWKFAFKFIIKKFNKWFLLYTDKWKLLKIIHNNDTDAYRYSLYKTFLNWKEVK